MEELLFKKKRKLILKSKKMMMNMNMKIPVNHQKDMNGQVMSIVKVDRYGVKKALISNGIIKKIKKLMKEVKQQYRNQ